MSLIHVYLKWLHQIYKFSYMCLNILQQICYLNIKHNKRNKRNVSKGATNHTLHDINLTIDIYSKHAISFSVQNI